MRCRIPVFDELAQIVAAGEQPEPDQAVEADALRPFPAVEADVVAGGAVEIGLMEAAVVLEAGHSGDKAIETIANIAAIRAHGMLLPYRPLFGRFAW